MVEDRVQGVEKGSYTQSADMNDTVETHQENDKNRENSMRTIFDNLREHNETTTLLLSSLLEQIQKQNAVLNSFAPAPAQNKTTVFDPQKADSDIESAQSNSSAPCVPRSRSASLNKRSSPSADEPLLADELIDEAPWFRVRRLSRERVNKCFRLFLGLVARIGSFGTNDMELFIRNKRISIKSLNPEQLQSLLASEWSAMDPSKPLWEPELSSMYNYEALFSDVQGGVKSTSVRGNTPGLATADASVYRDRVFRSDGIHICFSASVMVDSEECIPFNAILLAFSQLVVFPERADPQEDLSTSDVSTISAGTLLAYYIWPFNSEVIHHFAQMRRVDGSQCLMLILSGLRCAEDSDNRSLKPDAPVSGLRLLRQSGTLPVSVAGSAFSVREYRKMVYIRLFPDLDRRRLFYSTLTAAWEDISEFGFRIHQIQSVYKPLYVYLHLVRAALRDVQNKWTEVLDLLDGEINVTLKQVSTVEDLEDLLFDDLALSTSRKYFILLQHLRMYEEWIVGTCKGLSSWCDEGCVWFSHSFEPVIVRMDPAIEDLSWQSEELVFAWETTVKDAKRDFEPILKRIQAKRVGIVTLRDGLFNATAVREALQSSQLNQQGLRLNRYVFIFTITTIIYLPLSFVTGFFGMNNLGATSLNSSLMPFAWIAIAFCMGTYLLTFGGLGLYALTEKRRQNKRRANLHGQQSSTVDADSIFGETNIYEKPTAASKEARQESSNTAAAGNFTRRARDVFSNAIPMKTLRARRKQKARTESQA